MANTTRNAILRALIEGAVVDLMVKTKVDNVFVDDTTTLAAKLSEVITSLNAKATQEALTDGLNARPTTEEMNAAITAAITDLVNGAPEAYNTLKELADAIAENDNVMDALTAAIGNKADAATVASLQATVNALGSLANKSSVSESDLDDALKEKVNAASQGNHSHGNKDVLDGITSDKVAAWDGKGKFYAQASKPANLTANDLWAQII